MQMKLVKLTKDHIAQCSALFQGDKFMGNVIEQDPAAATIRNNIMFDRFVSTYLSDLQNYHAIGAIGDDGNLNGFLSFYESVEEPSWYYTLCRSNGTQDLAKDLLDYAIKYNEDNGRFKFYTLVNSKHAKLLRKFSWSEYNDNRYGYFDEYAVPAKHKCFYTNAWELLFKRMLLPTESTVRCSFLKQEYRDTLAIGGGL